MTVTTAKTAQEIREENQLAEAMQRRAESEASILGGRAERSRDPATYEDELRARIEAGQKAEAELDRLSKLEPKRDLSGMSRGLSDSEGNFAANADVLRTGGVGVEASNTDVSTGKPAQTPEAAGIVVPVAPVPVPEGGKVIGDQPVAGKVADSIEEADAAAAKAKSSKKSGDK